MPLRVKWIVCSLLFAFMLGTGAWLNRIILEDRPHGVIKAPASNGHFKGYSTTDDDTLINVPLHYWPREYVKIMRRER